MIGAMIGDIVGSIYEFDNIKTKDFPLFSEGCEFTDDTVMTIAVAQALLRSRKDQVPFGTVLVEEMQALGRDWPGRGYGIHFYGWLYSHDPQPYNSFGNGSAMRVAPCGLIAVTMEEALALAKASAEVTHNHPEGIKGAQATAAAVFLAKTGRSKEEIGQYIRDNFYPLDKTVDEIRPTYRFNESCQETVPQAITAFLESEDFEDALRNAISLGGDSDTLAAITCSIAWTYYCVQSTHTVWAYEHDPERLPQEMRAIADQAWDCLHSSFQKVMNEFADAAMHRADAYDRIGTCAQILI